MSWIEGAAGVVVPPRNTHSQTQTHLVTPGHTIQNILSTFFLSLSLSLSLSVCVCVCVCVDRLRVIIIIIIIIVIIEVMGISPACALMPI